jgi:rRNA maturation endonuclease Nob1
MIGGMASDVLEKVNKNTEQKVMIRCQLCKTLNEENSKFCQECGKSL